ncbi:MAG TPA: hypothetical protein VGD54_19555 [Steroidobacteraceae bacterium]
MFNMHGATYSSVATTIISKLKFPMAQRKIHPADPAIAGIQVTNFNNYFDGMFMPFSVSNRVAVGDSSSQPMSPN